MTQLTLKFDFNQLYSLFLLKLNGRNVAKIIWEHNKHR